MAVTYQNNSLEVVSTLETSITISVPTGFSVGDLLIACVGKDYNEEIILPTGWTLIQNDTLYCGFNVSYRIAESGDTSWSWTSSGARQWTGAILRYTGQDATTPIHASNKANGSSNSPTAPSVSYTSLLEGSLALQCFGADDDDTPYTTPGQLTERYNHISDTGFNTCGSAGGDKAISGTGSTGTGVFGMNAVEGWSTVTVVIAAAEAGEEYYDTVTFSGTHTPTILKVIDLAYTKSITSDMTPTILKVITFKQTPVITKISTFSILKKYFLEKTFLSSSTLDTNVLYSILFSLTGTGTPTIIDVLEYHVVPSFQSTVSLSTPLKFLLIKTLNTEAVPTIADIYTLASVISTTINNIPSITCKFKLNISDTGLGTPSVSSVLGKYAVVSFEIQGTSSISKVMDCSSTITLNTTIESFIAILQTLFLEESFSGIGMPTIDMKDLLEVLFSETSNLTSFLKFSLLQSLSQTSIPTANSKFLLNMLFTEQSILSSSLKYLLTKTLTDDILSSIGVLVSYQDTVLLTIENISLVTLLEKLAKLILTLSDTQLKDLTLEDSQITDLTLSDTQLKDLTLEDS